MSEEKLVPKLRFPSYSSEWHSYTLGEILTFYSTNSFSREKLNYDTGSVKNIHYGDIHTKFPSIVSIDNNKDIPFINDDLDLSKFSEDQYLREGDLIIADASEDYEDIGKAIEVKDINNEKVLAGLHTILARDENDMTVNGFKAYLFSTNNLKTKIKIIANGISVLGISKNNLSKLNVEIPSKKEQQNIVSFISDIDKKIELLEKKHQLYLDFKNYLMQQIFAQKLRFKSADGEQYSDWKERNLYEFLTEHKLKSTGNEEVYSVSVHKGLVNQKEHLGRDFSAPDTSKYNLVKPGDIVYTKSPTGDFPLGIIKQSRVDKNVIVSPLYGVFTPETYALGYILNDYFESNVNTHNYLHPIVQKGAKNTMNITNKTFLSKTLFVPTDVNEQQKIAECFSKVNDSIRNIEIQQNKVNEFKKGLLQQMFV